MHEAEKEANRINEELMKAEDELKDLQAAQKPPISSEGWMVPCKYIKLTSAWGYRNNPTNPSAGTEFHDGVDLANNTGTPIYATRSGTVHGVGYAESGHNLGNYVTLNHGDGFKSQYAHMTYFVVKKGQWVEQGQLIGYMGSTGRSTGPHLHFAIYYNGVSQNPASYMKLPIWP
jgi:murein DD-endopeptidase MepM/ murein hydrolase activator NlpD